MKIIHQSLILLGAMGLTAGCGILQKDDDSPGGSGGVTPIDFSLTGTETSEIQAGVVSDFVNRTTFMKTFKISTLNIAQLAAAQSGSVSRRKEGIAQCILTTINKIPLRVTIDSAGYDINLDFATCDTIAKPDDMVGEVKNTLKASLNIGCVGGITIDAFKGKTIGDLDKDIGLCNNAATVTYSYNYVIEARKTTLTKRDKETEVTGVIKSLSAASLAAPAGGPCVVNVDPVAGTTGQAEPSRIGGIQHLAACRLTFQQKTFAGKPSDEANSLRDNSKPHATVLQSFVEVSGATMEPGVPNYTGATTTFKLNDWTGVVTYPNGWVANWEATLPKTSAKIEGEIGVTANPQNGSNTTGSDSEDPSSTSDVPEPIHN